MHVYFCAIHIKYDQIRVKEHENIWYYCHCSLPRELVYVTPCIFNVLDYCNALLYTMCSMT